MTYIFLAILPAALIIAAANDLYEFKIPNWVSVILIIGYPLAAFSVNLAYATIGISLLIGGIILLVGFAIFALNIMGGGDVKLLAAAAPWFGMEMQMSFLTGTALMGGLFAIIILAFRGFPVLPVYARFSWLLTLHESKKGMPYGVAIAAGGLMAYPNTEIFRTIFV